MNDPEQVAHIASKAIGTQKDLSTDNIADLIAFLNTMSDPNSIKGRMGIPQSVPSGLSIP